MTQEQRDEAVRQVANGASYSTVARLFDKDVRTVERLFRPGAPLRLQVERLQRERELADYGARRKKAARSNGVLPIPTHPDDVAAMQGAMEQARAEILQRQAARERQRITRPVQRELTDRQAQDLWRLGNALRSGRITDADYNRRYDEIVLGTRAGRVPQVQVISIPRQAEYEYGPGNRAPADAFEGQYAR